MSHAFWLCFQLVILNWLKVDTKWLTLGHFFFFIFCCLLLTELFFVCIIIFKFDVKIKISHLFPVTQQMNYNSWFINDAKIFAVKYSSIWIGVKNNQLANCRYFIDFHLSALIGKLDRYSIYCCFLIVILIVADIFFFGLYRSQMVRFWIFFGIFLTWLSLSLVLAFHAKTFSLIDLPPLIFHFIVYFCTNSIPKPSSENEWKIHKKWALNCTWFLRTQTECGQMLREPTNTDHECIFRFFFKF